MVVRRRGQQSIQSKTGAESYQHKEQALIRPDVGLQAQFRKKKPPVTYQYDSSLDPELSWDINADREKAEALIEQARTATTLEQAHAAAEQLKRMSQPFLNWAGKKERSKFTVPTLPLFVHDRLSTKAILESVRTRKRQLELFADPQLPIADRLLKAYEHKDKWANRMILGDSLQVMNSLLEYEGMGGKVQMIYMDPPYGVKFGSNFQPFVRQRERGVVEHNNDKDFTREPEMVQAYRDTWELGPHSYLTYLRDRLQLAKELLKPTGSLFVQISDVNLQYVRAVIEEVFGKDNFVSLIQFRKTSNLTAEYLPTSCDYIVWFAKDRTRVNFHPLFIEKTFENVTSDSYGCVQLPGGAWRRLTQAEKSAPRALPSEWKLFGLSDLTSSHRYDSPPFEFQGRSFTPGKRYWSTSPMGLANLAAAGRLAAVGNTLRYKRYIKDFPVMQLENNWDDTGTGTQTEERLYVVQTSEKVVARCLLMTTDPGDLVLDPTCGSGTTAYVAEEWGRRWITIDTSRIPIALARQRLLTSTFDYFQFRDEAAAVAGGFTYQRLQNSKGEEVGGIVPHIKLETIANGERPKEEVRIDKPNIVSGITRVSGPFVVEATIPTPVDYDANGAEDAATDTRDHYHRLLEALRRAPVLRLPDKKTVTFKGVRPPAKALTIHAEAQVEGNGDRPAAFVFGPASGAVTEQLVFAAAKEANAKNYAYLYVIGFACQDAARNLIENAQDALGIPAVYVNATMDLQMGDLLKTTRSSELFSVTEAPEFRIVKLKRTEDGQPLYRVELLGLDVFDPVTMEVHHRKGDEVPAWFLDTDYNELSFLVSQAFFPKTGAWDNLKKHLKGVYDDSVWEHLAGTQSEPFTAGEHGRIAVKVIDERGNEVLVVRALDESEAER